MRATVRKIFENLRPLVTENENLTRRGHPEFVGGLWDELGQLQFHFLVKQGLRPDHVFLDIACGSLRAGRLLIPYLAPGSYLGIDKHAELIEAGKAKEIEGDVLEARHPEFVVSDCFSFENFSKRPDFASRNRYSRTLAGATPTCASGGCRLLLSLVVGFMPLLWKHRFRFPN